MLVVVARTQGKPERRQELVDALTACAAASRGDKGNRAYGFFADLEDENTFISLEEWDSQADLDAHFTQPHTAALLVAIADLVASPPTIHAHGVANTTVVGE